MLSLNHYLTQDFSFYCGLIKSNCAKNILFILCKTAIEDANAYQKLSYDFILEVGVKKGQYFFLKGSFSEQNTNCAYI